jgi:hypothetical protein
MLKEMFALLGGSIAIFAGIDPSSFIVTCIGSVILAGTLWWLGSAYVRLWNTTFHLSLLHNFLCGLAALWTIFFVIAFVSLREVGQLIDQEISAWTEQMHQSLESGSVPLSTDNATSVESPATTAALFDDFEAQHPFLRQALQAAQIGPPEQNTETEEIVSPATSIDDVAATIADAIHMHLAFLLLRLRTALILSLLLAQAIPFGFNGYLAHRDIRPV